MSTTETRPRTRPATRAPLNAAESPKRRPAQRRPRLRVVRARAPRRRRWALVLVSSLVVGGLLVGVVATQALVSQTSFHMRDLQARAKALRQVNTQLTLQVANLSAPDRIVAEARALGMGLPNSAAVQVLRPAANGPPGPAAAERGAEAGTGPTHALPGTAP